ncbi:hypothetical protein GmHk_04G010351 [Glycine max]|nr:hypothetical protein GmHk_04G010351 [Glycine max]
MTKATPPASPPPPPPADASVSPSTLKRTCKATQLRSLATRPLGAERPVVNVDPATDKADGPYKKKLRTYLGIVACDKVDVTYETWKKVPAAQKDLIWKDIHTEFEIPEASDSRTKKKILQTVGELWRKFKSDLTRKWALAADKDCVNDTDVRKKAQAIQKQNTALHVLSRGGYEYLEEKLMAEKTKKRLEEAAQSGSTEGIINPSSPIRRHVKWKMARTKKTGQMTSETAKEIVEKIVSHFQLRIVIIFVYYVNALNKYMCFVQDSLEEQASQGSFVPHGRRDVLTAAIGRPEHPGRVRAVGVGVTIKKCFGSAPRTSRSSSSMPPEDLQDQLQESITEKVTRQVMASFSQMQSQFQSQMQSQGLALPPEPKVGPSGARVNTKESCVNPSRNDPETGDSNKCGLYIEENSSRLVAQGILYEGSTAVHNIPLLHGQVKVGVKEVKDAEALVLVPTNEAAVSPAKPPKSPDHEVDDPLYLMTLTIPQLFLKPLQVMWDASLFRLLNLDFPLHLTEASMRAGNSDVYGFLEPQSIQRFGQSQFESESYIKSWMQSSKRDVYLGAYLNGALKGLDDTPEPKSKAAARWIVVKCNRQKGSTECGYCVMHRMSTIISGTFRNNWETYFNDVIPLEVERFKALRIQWAQYYLKVRNQT